MKIFSSLSSMDQIRGSPLGPMLREIVVRTLGPFQTERTDPGNGLLLANYGKRPSRPCMLPKRTDPVICPQA